MKTFAEIYCAEHHCDLGAFEWRVFWLSLHRRALAITPLLLCLAPNYFASDWAVIRAAGRCYSLRQVEEEIRDFALDSANRGWWRREARVRLSSQRFRRLARRCFIAGSQPSVSSRAPTR